MSLDWNIIIVVVLLIINKKGRNLVKTSLCSSPRLDGRPIIQFEEIISKEEELVECEKLIKMEQKKWWLSNIIFCLKNDFVLPANEGVKVLIIKFYLGRLGKFYFVENDKVKGWRINEKWCKINLCKLRKALKTIFKML